jgi:glycosyltransferase involved in cell wall biosynthesis
MHIAIDARIINSSTGRYVERLLTYLEKIDSEHRFNVLVRAKDKDYWKPTNKNFTVVVADYHQYTFQEQIGFYLFLNKLGADLVHFCMPQQPLLYRGKSVTTIHDLNLLRITENEGMSLPVLKVKQAIFKHLLRTVTKRSARIITPTHYTKDDLLRFQPVSSEKVVVTYEAADKVSDTEKPVERLIDKQFLLVVGRSESYKNQRGAILAHQQLIAKYPDLQLVLVGKRDKNSRDIESWVKNEGFRNVDFFGFASDDELAWLYSHCEVYVFPSFMEGFGLPPLEAMRHGAPVASSRASCLPEVLGKAALYFDPSDADDIAKTIETILNSKKLRDELLVKGKKHVDTYSWQRMAEQTLGVYNDAIKN